MLARCRRCDRGETSAPAVCILHGSSAPRRCEAPSGCRNGCEFEAWLSRLWRIIVAQFQAFVQPRSANAPSKKAAKSGLRYQRRDRSTHVGFALRVGVVAQVRSNLASSTGRWWFNVTPFNQRCPLSKTQLPAQVLRRKTAISFVGSSRTRQVARNCDCVCLRRAHSLAPHAVRAHAVRHWRSGAVGWHRQLEEWVREGP